MSISLRDADPAGAIAGAARRRFRQAIAPRRGLMALALVAPLFLFLLATFVAPVATLLVRSVDNREIGRVLPHTAKALHAWDGTGLPDEHAFAALADDLRSGSREDVAAVARLLNTYHPGARSLLIRTARTIAQHDGIDAPSPRGRLVRIDPAWNEAPIWQALRRALPPFTDHYLLAALDLRREASGAIVAVEPDSAIYRDVLGRTLGVSLSVTVGCLLLGYPLAYLMAQAGPRTARILLLLVLLPFWTSLLVRTTAWAVVLQNQGVLNTLLAWTGLIDPGHPLELIYNRTGVLIAMIHILLPFMILPVHGAMKAIPANYLRAAASLGAPPRKAFLRVFLPLSMPGVVAGTLMVFILALGYYITPSLVGGTQDQMLGFYIAYFANQVSNWGMAAALSAILLAAIVLLYAVFHRVVGIDRLRIG